MIKVKTLGIILLVCGVIGFIAFNESKDKYQIFETEYSMPGNYSEEIDVLSGDEYTFSVWGLEEEFGLQAWASVEYGIEIIDESNNILLEKKYVATESEEKGGVIRAQNGSDHKILADYNGKLIVNTAFIEGDEVTIDIYQNLPDRVYYMPVLFIAVFIIGLLIFLKGRANNKTISFK